MEPTQLNEQTTSISESIPLGASDTFPIEIYTNERIAEYDPAEAEAEWAAELKREILAIREKGVCE
jgi:hypothetical protein